MLCLMMIRYNSFERQRAPRTIGYVKAQEAIVQGKPLPRCKKFMKHHLSVVASFILRFQRKDVIAYGLSHKSRSRQPTQIEYSTRWRNQTNFTKKKIVAFYC